MRRALLWFGGAVVVGVAALTLAAKLIQPTAAPAVAANKAQAPSPPRSAASSPLPTSATTPPDAALAAGTSEAQRLSATALLALDCRQRAQAPPSRPALLPGADAEDAAAAAARRAAERQRLAACRGVAGFDAAQIEAMLRSAAARGDADAQRQLLAQRVAQLVARAGSVDADGQRTPLSAADERDAEDVVTQLEDRALHGDRTSIDALAQLLRAPWLAVADPPYAAAWQLAARQAPERPFPPPEQALGAEELLDGLNEAQRQQALNLAPALFAQCCARR
ncbi:hypothetical protein [Xanthomonas rydalmerensis]|uniref:Secreted protein n=1 Tax=Xanthomonas rydalmerensis TaxID=3046274 RepID=A0ABZ0JN76_9XANT|nr:hypothetical protein [Xanthomonas sp. DM-2023]WOS40828.1 hypothetical protein QN243_20975 [Xanthomonas sp. DM-2023]WOS45012.1 hypothetical protein QN242_20975 [Xanthomonas sp. DM-2023]WOS49192.1 hypothetical protein QN240_20975 [Xanthomonas sp. DM-2023]WOS53372.1 hypothetical protein QN244_20980 [Xanthomonas sp. DM-2023]WOS57555.1 hypothetical protein QN245_20975 [Xanthomonas sp. DM-2023]